MTKYFMARTPHAGAEAMMMLPPNFKPRGSGKQTGYKYTAADCDCKYCLIGEKKKRACESVSGCVCFEERLAAGCWTYGELTECFAKEVGVKALTKRTLKLLPPKTSSPFKDKEHIKRMNTEAAAMTKEPNPFTAAVFLLSADSALWKRSRQAIHGGSINFDRIETRGIGLDGYTLLQTAKDLYLGGCRLTVDDLCDEQIIDDELFRLLVSAFVIRRYGIPWLLGP